MKESNIFLTYFVSIQILIYNLNIRVINQIIKVWENNNRLTFQITVLQPQ